MAVHRLLLLTLVGATVVASIDEGLRFGGRRDHTATNGVRTSNAKNAIGRFHSGKSKYKPIQGPNRFLVAPLTMDFASSSAGIAVFTIIGVLGLAALVAVWWAFQGEDTGINDSVTLNRVRRIVGETYTKHIPSSVDIFTELEHQDAYDWPATFATFLVRLDTDGDRLIALVKSGTQWKIRLFHFLHQALKDAPDISTGDVEKGRSSESRRHSGEKSRILNFALSILATMDIWDFRSKMNHISSPKAKKGHGGLGVESKQRKWLGASNKKILGIEKTIMLLQKATDYLNEVQRHSACSQLYALICSKLAEDSRAESDKAQSDFIDNPRWGNVMKLLDMIRHQIFQPDRSKGFKLAIKDGQFVDISCVMKTAEFLETKYVTTMLSEQRHMEMLQDRSTQKARWIIGKRSSKLTEYRDLYTSLAAVMKRANQDPKIKTRGRTHSRDRGSRASSRGTNNSGKRLSSRDTEIKVLLEKVEEAYAAQEKLVTTLVLLQYGNAGQLRTSLKIHMSKVKESKDRRSLTGSARALPRSLQPASSLVVRLISDIHAEEVRAQMTKKPRLSSALGRAQHIVYMSGVEVVVTELGVDRLQGAVKSNLLIHQQISTHGFIQMFYGTAHTPKGWVSVTEKVCCTLSDLYGENMEVSIDDNPRFTRGRYQNARQHLPERIKMKLAVGIASGLHCIHGADSHHGNLNPKAIGLDTSFQVKLLDFGHPPEMDTKVQDSAYLAPEFFTRRRLGSLPKVELLRKADIYACGTLVAELFGSERRRLRDWLPPNLADAFQKIEMGLNPKNPQQVPAFNVHKILEPRRPELSGFLAHCISITAEHRPEMKKVKLAFQSLERDASHMEGGMIYLDTSQSQSMSTQLTESNRSRMMPGYYRVKLAGITVDAKLLNIRSMKGEALSHVKGLMALCSRPTIVDAFGCSWSERHGWVLATEHIPNNLRSMLRNASSSSSFKTKLKMAINIVEGLMEFHNSRMAYHLTLDKICVTNGFRVKLLPYNDPIVPEGKQKIDLKLNLKPPELYSPIVDENATSPLSDGGEENKSDASERIAVRWSRKSDIFVLGSILAYFLSDFEKRRHERRRAKSQDLFRPHTSSSARDVRSVTKGDSKYEKNSVTAPKFLLVSDPNLSNSHPTLGSRTNSNQLGSGSEKRSKRSGSPPPRINRQLLTVPKANSNLGADLSETLGRCMDRYPAKRPTIDEVRMALMDELQEVDPTANNHDKSMYERSSRRPFALSPSRSRNPSSRNQSMASVNTGTPERKKRKMLIRNRKNSSGLLDMPIDDRMPRPPSGDEKSMNVRRRPPLNISREGSINSGMGGSNPTISPRNVDSPKSDPQPTNARSGSSRSSAATSPRPPNRGDRLSELVKSSRARRTETSKSMPPPEKTENLRDPSSRGATRRRGSSSTASSAAGMGRTSFPTLDIHGPNNQHRGSVSQSNDQASLPHWHVHLPSGMRSGDTTRATTPAPALEASGQRVGAESPVFPRPHSREAPSIISRADTMTSITGNISTRPHGVSIETRTTITPSTDFNS